MILAVFTVVLLALVVGAFVGAPFLPARYPDVEVALDLAELKPGETLIDLGSGDGRVLIAAAKRGANAIGYEVSPILFAWSWLRCRRYRRNIKIYLRDYWLIQLPPADVIYTFLVRHLTNRLDSKLSDSITKPTRVISYVFDLPKPPTKQTRNTFLYLYP